MKKLLLSLTLLLTCVPAAQAATVSLTNGELVYKADSNEGISLLISSRQDYDTNQTYLSFSDDGANGQNIADGAPCIKSSGYDPVLMCELNTTRPIRVIGSEIKDDISIFSANDVPDSIPFTFLGNGGDDHLEDAYNSQSGRTLIGGPGNDKLEGYAGNDDLDGGDGNDTVDGGEGDDRVIAGAGDDILWGDHYKAAGADVLDGGPGTDSIDEWSNPSGDVHPLPTVTQDGVANDGRPGEGDNVTSVERIELHINGTIDGTEADDVLTVVNVDEGAANFRGLGGNDTVKGYDTADKIDGGPGNDKVEGGLGNDTVIGGPGQDQIMGDSSAGHCGYYSCKVPFGNDTIEARDGEADQIDCGIGEDVANVDAVDTVTGCETVNKSGSSNGGPGDNGGPGKDGGPAGSGLKVSGATLKALLAGKLTVEIPCATACRISATAKAGGKTVATGSKTMLKAGVAKVALKVKSRKAARKAKGKRITVSVKVTGADGKPKTLTGSVKLK